MRFYSTSILSYLHLRIAKTSLMQSLVINILVFLCHQCCRHLIDTDKKNSRMWLTINPKGVNKLSTLEKICKDLKCSIDEVVFFGDGENDLVLIENVGIGIAMDNAIKIVKEKASFVTLSNDADGIAEYLENNLNL